jgi:TRAP-type C4-dicarboxylate transport system substrate-binding protein
MSVPGETIRIAGYQPDATVNSRAIRKLATLLEAGETADGPISTEVTSNILELGLPTAALVSKVADGTFDMATTTSIHFHAYVPELQVFDIPFLIGSRDRARDVLDTGVRPLLGESASRGMPVKVLAIWDNGVRQVSNSVRPIHGPAECRGLRLRTQTSPLIREAMALVGFEAVSLDIGKLVGAIERGEVDAQENPLINIHGFGLDRLHRHIALTEHLYGVSFLVCSPARWASWSPVLRDHVVAAAEAATTYQRALAREEDVRLRTTMADAGTLFTEIGPEARRSFAAKIAPIRKRFADLLERPALKGLMEA